MAKRKRNPKLILLAVTIGACVLGPLIVVLLTHGVDGVVSFFTERRLEAGSGRKYDPAGAVKRFIEKIDE